MKTKKQSARDWLDDLFDWEAKHPIAFASPSALRETRLMVELEKARRTIRRLRRNGKARPPRRRTTAAA